MPRHRIPSLVVASLGNRWTGYSSAAVFVLVLYGAYTVDDEFSVHDLLGATAASALFAFRLREHFLTWLSEESAWEIEPVDGALLFHRGKVVARIDGQDISRIHVARIDGRIKYIDVSYGDQSTRIRHHENLEALHRHLLQIAPLKVAYPGKR